MNSKRAKQAIDSIVSRLVAKAERREQRKQMEKSGPRKCCGTPRGYLNPHAETCPQNPKNQGAPTGVTQAEPTQLDGTPTYSGSCIVCGATPIIKATRMCGPCTFGEADTAGGNW